MANDTSKQFTWFLRVFLRNKLRSGDVIVRSNEVEELAQSCGMDAEDSWEIFKRLKGRNKLWEGHYLEGTQADAHGHLAARLTWVTWVNPGY